MPLSVFVGVDNNGRTRLLVQAVISDETFETYQWILQSNIESTSRVEGMNAIIKKTVRSNSTLCHLVDSLSERLTSELQWKRFYEYRSATTNSILLSTGDDLFPSITEILEKYLTINIATTIKEEMLQCLLYLQVTIISFSEVDFIQDQKMEEHVGFIEDNYNVQMIKLQSIIDEIGKEDIKEIWKICDI
ncbi:protein FAR1-RELATED SEQUENCE 11-like [Rhizophagus irregularis DAOM 181602=DAOM 197198]|nr:protein FAR1-RELATED SEQUENCE 11-like [Rhizophagus irregularis DAOM 181602=DAOM 197198]